MATCVELSGSDEHDKDEFEKAYPFSFLKNLSLLWKQEVFCDVSFKCESHTFHAHKIVVSAGCPFFKAMFDSGMSEGHKETIDIFGVAPDIFKQLIEFIYTGHIEVGDENCEELLAAADMYGMEEVLNKCCAYLKQNLHRGNCLGIYQFSDLHGCSALKEEAERFVNNHFVHLSKEEEFKELSANQLTCLLQSEYLLIDEESQVLEAAMKWLLHDPVSRQKYILDILSPIRFQIIPVGKVHKILKDCSHLNISIVVQKHFNDSCMDRNKTQRTQMQQSKLQPHMLQPRKSARKCIYIIGGCKQSDEWRWSDGVTLSCVEKLDPFSGHWANIQDMKFARSGHGAAVLNGLIYVVGGENNSLISDTVECFDPVTEHWQMAACMVHPRSGHGVCAVGDYLYALGGWVGETLDNSVEEYCQETDSWRVIGTMPMARYAMGVVSYEGLIYIMGGLDMDEVDTCECYSFNPITKEWNRLADLKVQRSHHGISVCDGKIFCVGGVNHALGDLKHGECYDIENNKWSDIAPLPDQRSGMCAVSMEDKLFLLGGQRWKDRFSNYSAPITLDNIDCYNSKSNSWSKQKSMKLDRCKGAAVAL